MVHGSPHRVGSYLRAQLDALGWNNIWRYHGTQPKSNYCGFRALAFVNQRLRGDLLSGCLPRAFVWSCSQVLRETGVDCSSMDALLTPSLALIDRQQDSASQDVVTGLVKEAIAEVEGSMAGRIEGDARRRHRRQSVEHVVEQLQPSQL